MNAKVAKVVERDNPKHFSPRLVYSVDVWGDYGGEISISIPCKDKVAAEALLHAIHVHGTIIEVTQ